MADTDCPRLQGGGCALGDGPAPASECDTGAGDSTIDADDTAAGRLEGSGCSCAAPVASQGAPLLAVLLLVALRRVLPVLLAVAVATDAFAADAQHLSPADGGPFTALAEGWLGNPWEGRAAITTSYATDVAVLRAGEAETPVLPSVVTAEMGASLRLDKWFAVGVVVPEHVYVQFGSTRLANPIRGDIGVRLAIPVTNEKSPIRGSWSVQWDAPSRGYAFYLGDTGATVGRLALDGEVGPWLLGTNLGLRMQRPDELPGAIWANRFEYGFGAVFRTGPLGLGAELIGSLPVRGRLLSAATAPAEVLMTARTTPGRSVSVRVGGGVGLGHGLGAPAFRAFVGVDLRTREPRDPDLDGLINLRDACDDDPEDQDEYADLDGCPDPDNDHDGLLDPVDECPNDPEARNGWKDEDGCPDRLARVALTVRSSLSRLESAEVHLDGTPERGVLADEVWRAEVVPGDRRLLVTAKDHHPYDAEVELHEGNQELVVVLDPILLGGVDALIRGKGGQPIAGTATVDGREIAVSTEGAWFPVEAGERTVAFASPGYVSRYVRLTIRRGQTLATTVDLEPMDVFTEGDRIQIRGEVWFPLDRAEPSPESLPALEALAAWLIAHPEVELVRVEGYADGLGGSRYNYGLSVRRAEAVRDRLIALGVAGERLVAVGAGEARAESAAEDASSRKVGLLVLIWNDDQTLDPEAPQP